MCTDRLTVDVDTAENGPTLAKQLRASRRSSGAKLTRIWGEVLEDEDEGLDRVQ